MSPSNATRPARHATGARRILTAVQDGVSRISQVTDQLPTLDTPGGAQICEVWHTRPGEPLGGEPQELDAEPVAFQPPPGATSCRLVTIPPDRQRWGGGTDASALFAAMGASDARAPVGAHPGMHVTQTLDYVYVVSGEVVALMEDGPDGEVPLRAGDVVVQRRTLHAWKNVSDAPALLFVVMVGV